MKTAAMDLATESEERMLLTSGNSDWSDTVSVLWEVAPCDVCVRVCLALSTCAQQLCTRHFIYNYKMNLLLL